VARYSAAFVWAALGYFTLGMLLGLAMALDPTLMGRLRTAHVHVNLLGWVSMFIFGVAYHVLPRFTGQPLHSPRLADLHVVLANVGLVGMALGFALHGPGPVVAVFGALETLGGLSFVYNVARTLLAARRAPELLPLARPAAGALPRA
jgi:cbb3-type cytochrome oxidase subunit 1